MEEELAFFQFLSSVVIEKDVKNLNDEKNKPKPKTEKIKNKEIKNKEPKVVKDAKLKTFTLTENAEPAPAAPGSESDSASEGNEEIISDESENGEEGKKGKFQFGKLYEHKEVSMKLKGKSKYQQLRQAAYREKIEAENPEAAAWDKAKRAAHGEKVELTAAQIKKNIKKESKEKQKRYEKRKEKEIKAKKQEQREARKAEMKANRKGKPGKGRK